MQMKESAMMKVAETLARRKAACGWLRERKVGELVSGRRRLVEVPYTASLRDTMNSLVANDVVAVPVAAPPGRWIGAGGTMIVELDPATGAARKQYIGMVTMLDILIHLSEEQGEELAPAVSPRASRAGAAGTAPRVDLEQQMSVPVSSIIGHSLEGLSMWTFNPHTSVLDCMEAFSKGVHRALVPLESHAKNVVAAELVESSPGYRMLTQMDVVSFLRTHNTELGYLISDTVGELGVVNETVLSVTTGTRVIDALKIMRAASLSSVPVVEAQGSAADEPIPLQVGKGRKLVSTFSATDLRGCPIDLLQQWLTLSVVEFKDRATTHRAATVPGGADRAKALVTCRRETTLAQVIEEAVASRVHRVWAVDERGLLMGLVSLSDMLRAIRESLLVADREP